MIDRTHYCIAGNDFKVNDNITIHNPTLQEIIDFGERNYERLCGLITMRPYDDMVNLWDRGIDYTQVKDYDLFLSNIRHLDTSLSSLLFGELDFTKFQILTTIPTKDETEGFSDSIDNVENEMITSEQQNNNKDNTSEIIEPMRVILYQQLEDGTEVVIDEAIYNNIVDYVRVINDIDPKIEYDVGNNAAKMFLIERMRTKIKRASKKPYQPKLCNYISAIVAMGVGYTYSSIMELKISQLYDLFKRIIKIEEYRNLMGAAHAGAKLTGDDKQRLNWYGSL